VIARLLHVHPPTVSSGESRLPVLFLPKSLCQYRKRLSEPAQKISKNLFHLWHMARKPHRANIIAIVASKIHTLSIETAG